MRRSQSIRKHGFTTYGSVRCIYMQTKNWEHGIMCQCFLAMCSFQGRFKCSQLSSYQYTWLGQRRPWDPAVLPYKMGLRLWMRQLKNRSWSKCCRTNFILPMSSVAIKLLSESWYVWSYKLNHPCGGQDVDYQLEHLEIEYDNQEVCSSVRHSA